MRVAPLSKEFLANRGVCCGNGCLNCPHYKKHTKGETKMLRIAEMTLREALNDMLNAKNEEGLNEAHEAAKESLQSLYDALRGDL